MIKIVHMSDSHLGYRAKRGTINKWAVQNNTKPYEQDIYDCFLKVMESVSNIENLDFLIHCGDMFHIPSNNNSYPPPEPARKTLKEGLDLFFKNTENQVPFIYIEGNHGIFRGYEYTPFESHIDKKSYPNLYYFKERDLLNVIKKNQPLVLEFREKLVRFYLFPYFEFRDFEVYNDAYNKWIENQKPNQDDNYINIAIAHGSDLDGTLHKKLIHNDFSYDYIALGHEHGLKKVSNKIWYSGSLLPLNFKEIFENQGYLVASIEEKTKKLKIEKFLTQNFLKRPFKIIQINITPKNSSLDINNLVTKELEEFISKNGFDHKTSARLKINFIGEMTFEKVWLINDIMTRIRREIFSQSEKFNILQIFWQTSDISESVEDDISAGIIEDYILEEPDENFKEFIKEKLSDEKTKFDIDKLAHFGMKAIKNALKNMEKEKEV
ncbi:MAG: exonuclease SbcCD subunit D [Promethearchaeota archaeon]